MEILKIELQNTIYTIEKINGAYLVDSKFTNDASSGEVFEYVSLIEAQNHVNNEIKEYTRLMDDLHNTLLLALNLSQQLNLDISSDINGLLDNF
jgi:uncharacterized protein YeeX (DUF496 family)